MPSDKKLSPLAKALGITTVVAGLAAMPIANAASNPFQMNDLDSGYKVAEKGKEGKCGEGKCGEGKKGKKEGKCGGEMKKGAKDGNCGEGKCGSNMKKDSKEGKCGGKK